MEPEQASMGPVTQDRRGQAAGLRDARSHLRQADPVLARLIDERPDFDPRGWMAELPAMDLYGALVFQVTGQQLSVASTRRILARIRALFGGHLPSPEELLRADPAEVRRAGLSGRRGNGGWVAAGISGRTARGARQSRATAPLNAWNAISVSTRA